MSSVDSRIVTMKFDNGQFEKGAGTTISTLDRLKQALHLPGATKGLENVQDAANRTNLGTLQGGVTKVSAGFTAMATIAITALATITQKAMSAGAQIIKSLTLQPVMDGFKEYELKMGSIQTILANTEKDGTTLEDVSAALDELNTYADKTIYSFGEMTKTIGLFTNAGINIESATSMIKGFSNAAAASGATAEGTARAQYQLSQALTTGTIRLMDWKSLTNAGMGNKNMQTSLINIAEAMGEFEGKSITAKEAGDNFNGSLEKEWLSAGVMEQYLKIMAGEVTPAQMKSIGLSQEQIDVLVQEAKTAEEAATKVRTFTQLMGTTRESIGSGWAATFDIILGDFNEATELFSGISSGISDFVNRSAEARNKMLQDWKDLGGRDTLIEGLKTAIQGLGTIIKPVAQAFREIFPATTGKQLYDLTVKFKEFTEKIKIGSDTALKLKETFKGFFAIFSIVGQVIKGFIGVIFDLIGAVGKSSGGFLDITSKIGKFLSGVDSALKSGDGLTKFFETLSAVLQTPVKLIQALASYVIGVFSGFNQTEASAINGTFERMGQRLGPLAALFESLWSAMETLSTKIKAAYKVLTPYVDAIKNAFKSIGKALREAFSGADLNSVLDLINTGLFAALLIMVRKFLKNFTMDFGGGFIESIRDTFGALTGTLQAMQTNIKADTLFKIAGAVAMLTASIIALSLIDSDKLTKAMFAITVAFGQLVVAMAILTKVGGMTGFIKIPIITAGMILMAGAVVILAQAIKTLSKLDLSELAKGLIGVSGAMGVLVIGIQPFAKMSGGMIATGLGVLAFAFALKTLATAVGKFASYDLGEIAKGLTSIIATLIILTVAITKMPPNLPMIGLGLIGVGVGLGIFAAAIKKMGELEPGTIVIGLVGIAGALALMALAMGKMPPNMILTAIALVAVGIAMQKIGDAVSTLGGMSLAEIAKGLTALALSLTILGVAMALLSGSIMGAVAIATLAVSLGFLVPALKALGNLSLKEIVVSLLALAAVFTVLGVAAYLINAAAVVILALAASLALLGAAVALTGLGILAFAKGIEILVTLGGAAATAMATMLSVFIQAIPKMMNAFAQGIIEFTITITKNIPVFMQATYKLLNGILDVINEMAPKIAKTMGKVLNLMLDYVVANSPKIVNAGYKLLIDFLTVIKNNIYQVVTVATQIMIRFARAIGDNAPAVADEGVKTVIKLINAMANAIRNNSKEMNAAGRNLSSAIITGFIGGITSGVTGVIQAIVNMAKGAIAAAKKILGIKSPSKEFEQIGVFVDSGFASGIRNNSNLATDAVEDMGSDMLDEFRTQITDWNQLVEDEMSLDPVITPVIDMSEVQKEKWGDAAIDALVQAPVIPARQSNVNAMSIASDSQYVSAGSPKAQAETKAPTTIKFEQNNYSPKALSEVELYRQTRNQLALAKGALA